MGVFEEWLVGCKGGISCRFGVEILDGFACKAGEGGCFVPAGAIPDEPAPGGYVTEVMGMLGGKAVGVTEVGRMSDGGVHGMSLSVE